MSCNHCDEDGCMRCHDIVASLTAERDALKAETARLTLRVSDLKLALGMDATGWFDRCRAAEEALRTLREAVAYYSERCNHARDCSIGSPQDHDHCDCGLRLVDEALTASAKAEGAGEGG